MCKYDASLFSDGTHIPVRCADHLKESYICRKKFSSMQTQLVVDHEGFITDVFSGIAGSRHDAAVLEMSELGAKIEDCPHEVC